MGPVKLGLLWTVNLFHFLKHQYFFFLENLGSVHLQSNSTFITDLPLSQGSWPWPYQLLESSTNQNLVLLTEWFSALKDICYVLTSTC